MISLIFSFVLGLNGAQAKVLEFKAHQSRAEVSGTQLTWTLVEDGQISPGEFRVLEEGLRFFWASLKPQFNVVYVSPEQLPEGGVDLVFLLQKNRGMGFDSEGAFTELLESEGERPVAIVHLLYDQILRSSLGANKNAQFVPPKALVQVLKSLSYQFFGWALPGVVSEPVGVVLEAEVRASRDSLNWLQRLLQPNSEQGLWGEESADWPPALRQELLNWYQEEESRLLIRRVTLAKTSTSAEIIPWPPCKALLQRTQAEL